MKKELSDVKLLCEGKTFDCHKLVLVCQSDVFEAMLKKETKMVESESAEVKIEKTKAETLENMIYFMYHDKVDEKKINSDLLILADRFNVKSLTFICIEYLEENLSLENALDVLAAAHLTSKKDLFHVTANFVYEYKENVVKTDAWKELSEDHPDLIFKIMKAMLNFE